MRILIAEDEILLAYAMRGQLEQRGVEVVGLVTNGNAVLERCQACNPDVILMDVRMPGMNGLEATRLIMQVHPICIILITALSDNQTKAQAEAAGAMCVLAKPIQASEVLTAIPQAKVRFTEFEIIRAESEGWVQAIESQRLLEMAKSLLIEHGTSPEEAFNILKKSADRNGVSLRELSKKVLEEGGLANMHRN